MGEKISNYGPRRIDEIVDTGWKKNIIGCPVIPIGITGNSKQYFTNE